MDHRLKTAALDKLQLPRVQESTTADPVPCLFAQLMERGKQQRDTVQNPPGPPDLGPPDPSNPDFPAGPLVPPPSRTLWTIEALARFGSSQRGVQNRRAIVEGAVVTPELGIPRISALGTLTRG